MTTPSAQHIDAQRQRKLIDRKLRRAWHKERRYHHFRAACQVALWAVALILIDFGLDWLLRLPYYGRVMLLAFNGAVLAWALWHHWLRYLRRYDPVRVALQVEARNPELESLLVSFVQLREKEGEAAYASPQLLDAMRRQAGEATAPLDFKRIISYTQLRRIGLVSLAAVLFFTAISINWRDYFHALVIRLINPAANVDYPTRTQIVEITGDLVVQQGERVVIEVRAEGQVPQEGKLLVRPVDGEWERLPLLQNEPRQFACRFPDVYQSFDYRVKIGDDESRRHRVVVVPPPQIVDTSVIVKFPQYTGGQTSEKDTLNVQAPERTEITWQLTLDQPLAEAELILDSPGFIPQLEQGSVRGIDWEIWKPIPGSDVKNLTNHQKFQQPADETRHLDRFQIADNVGDNYGTRVRGYLVPPTSGAYRFYLNSDDGSVLYLSPSTHPDAKRKIAELKDVRPKGDFTSLAEQKSGPIELKANRPYYIEALHKEGPGADYMAVAWSGPGIDGRQVISGKHLMPWQGEEVGPQPGLKMKLDETGRVASLSGMIEASFGYRFRWTEKRHGYQYDEDVQYDVLATPDTPPQVELAHPSDDIKATTRKTMSLRYRANDDYGIARAWLVWQLNDGQEKRVELDSYAKPVVEDTKRLKLAEIIPGLAEGDTLTYSVEVTDNRNGGRDAQTARSTVRNMYIVSIAEYQQSIYERMADMTREVRNVHRVEVEGEQEVESILESGDSPERSNP